jgi:hypothetical protein
MLNAAHLFSSHVNVDVGEVVKLALKGHLTRLSEDGEEIENPD